MCIRVRVCLYTVSLHRVASIMLSLSLSLTLSLTFSPSLFLALSILKTHAY